jgi:hypothetical protein
MIKVVKFPINKNRQMTPIKLFLLKISILIVPTLKLSLIKGIPKPTKRLNKGPDMDPDKAISLYPKETKLKFSIKSDILFP